MEIGATNEKKMNRPFILASVMLGMFLSAIEGTIVATAIPTIVADLGGFSLYSWIFSAYLLTNASTILIFGKLCFKDKLFKIKKTNKNKVFKIK